jgi:hypothetical protein
VAGGIEDFVAEAVLDKGYHSRQTLLDLEEMNIRTYASEPARRGRQDWADQADAKDAVYANRRRIKGERGKRLLSSRGEKFGTDLRPLQRDRRYAAGAPARPGQRRQACDDARPPGSTWSC